MEGVSLLEILIWVTSVQILPLAIAQGKFLHRYIPVNLPSLHGSLPRKSLISCMDWVSCVGDINLPHTPFPPARSPPNKKIVYFLQSPYLFTIDRLFPSIVEMFRTNFYRVSLYFLFRNTKLIVVYVIERITTPIRNVHSR